MREEQIIFERNILTEDVESYNPVIGKDLIIEKSDNRANILNEVEDGSSFIIKGDDYDTRYTKIAGGIYKNIIVSGDIKLKQIELEEIL